MYQLYGKINRGQVSRPLQRGCTLFGGSVIRGFTVCILLFITPDKREIGMKPNPAYETVTKLNPSKSARQIATKPCPAYEGVALALH